MARVEEIVRTGYDRVFVREFVKATDLVETKASGHVYNDFVLLIRRLLLASEFSTNSVLRFGVTTVVVVDSKGS